MVDLHCHILPGMDDGASTLDEACEMAYMAYQSGVDTIVATPHFMPGIYERCQTKQYEKTIIQLRKELVRYEIPVTILSGMEVYIGEQLHLEEFLKKAQTINHSRYLLIEFNMQEELELVNEYLKQISSLGYTPVIAHPERYAFVQEMPESILDWRREGYVLQINKGSVLGRFGRGPRMIAHWMIDHDMVQMVASDAHSAEVRTPYMGEIEHYLSEYMSKDYARMVLYENPAKVIEDRMLTEEDKRVGTLHRRRTME